MTKYLDRITINPEVMHGQPAIRNMRFTVSQMLELLAGGMNFDEILEDYPYVEREDIVACLYFAAKLSESKHILAFSWNFWLTHNYLLSLQAIYALKVTIVYTLLISPKVIYWKMLKL